MATVRGLPQGHVCAHLALRGQAPGGHKGVVACVDHQRRHPDGGQVRLGRRAGPVVFGALEAMQRRGEDVVELVQVTRGLQRRARRTGPGAAAACARPWAPWC